MSDVALHELLVALKTELHQPTCRANPSRLAELLHDDFMEIGRSGRTYRKADFLELPPDAAQRAFVASREFKTLNLALDVALVTYRSASVVAKGESSKHALRSSLWLRTQSAWQMRFH